MAAVSGRVDITYRYPYASSLTKNDSELLLDLATCGPALEHPFFFRGRATQPRALALMLLVLGEVAQTHFFRRALPNLDPVVTSSPETLRFEAFSGCCGVYARVDLPAHAFNEEFQGRGTTNVNFNRDLRSALLRIRDQDEVCLSVGREGLELKHADTKVIERKVRLPVRWIKSFSNVQAYQLSLQPRLQVTAAEGRRFIRSLSTSSGARRLSYVAQSGPQLRLTQVAQTGAVPVDGTDRIRILEPLLSMARTLRVWSDDGAGTSGWEVEFPIGRFFLLLSPGLDRGFSGEGQLLTELVKSEGQEAVSLIMNHLCHQSCLEAGAIAQAIGRSETETRSALALLGAKGLLGFDITANHYFHRELPFDLAHLETLYPRLTEARELFLRGGVKQLEPDGSGGYEATVEGTSTLHFVRLLADGDRCSCPWFSKHQGDRGPCKHVMAARMALESDDDEEADEA